MKTKKIKSNQLLVEPEIGKIYDYYEEGLACQVKLLEIQNDAEGFGFKLELVKESQSFGKVGEKFSCWASHDSYACSGMWRLYPAGEYIRPN
jgi:hypothetical protein